MAICIKCDEPYSDARFELGYKTCLFCGSARQKFLAIPVAKSNYIVGTLDQLKNSNHKGPRTW
jgi:hypothetical protein